MKSNKRASFKVIHDLYLSNKKITMLTAYDASLSKILEDSNIDSILVGDSLGHCIHGDKSTLSVSLNDIYYHLKCVRKGAPNTWIIADLPFCIIGAEWSVLYKGATRLISAGANMIKIEGGAIVAKTIEKLVSFGIPVCGHLGLMPQHINITDGYSVQGRKPEEAKKIIENSKILESSGVSILLLECIPSNLSASITSEINIPTIGIGAGIECSGQILVSYDILGLSLGYTLPKFVRTFMSSKSYTPALAIEEYCDSVRNKTYPTKEESYM